MREAINAANAHAGADNIDFNIPGSGVKTISPTSQLPTITDPITIDGYTQPGAKANSLKQGTDAILLVELDGEKAVPALGLKITAPGSTVRGLVINRFTTGISIEGGTAQSIEGNFIGIDPTGTESKGNFSSGFL